MIPNDLWRTHRTFFLQISSSYAVQALRVINWAIAASLIYRWEGATAFAAFSFARAIVSAINYTSFGVAPALVTLLPQMKVEAVEASESTDGVLNYSQKPSLVSPPPAIVMWRTGMWLAWGIPFAIFFIAAGIAAAIHPDKSWLNDKFWGWVKIYVWAFGIGTFLKMFGDVCGARLQVEGKIALDNLLQLISDIVWLPGTFLFLFVVSRSNTGISHLSGDFSQALNAALVVTIGLSTFIRYWFAQRADGKYIRETFNFRYAKLILAIGFGMLIGQLADFLYAPANQILIKTFLTVDQIGVYAPTLHVDGALLLLVGGLAMLLFPKAAIAYQNRDFALLRRYYVLGTLTSVLILAFAAIVVCLCDDWIFKLWFGDPLPATQVILPLVLIHTVIGGSASIGRSILFGMGRIKMYAIIALIGGVANVGLAVLFLTQTSWGLKGIIYATIITVSARCAIWLPIYTLWTIRTCSKQTNRINQPAA